MTTGNYKESKEKKLTKPSYIQVPNQLISNPKVSHNAVFLYIQLTLAYSSEKKLTNIKLQTLKEKTNWLDNRTLMKPLEELKELNWIKYDFDKFPKSGVLQIKVRKPTTNYTQLERYMVQEIIEIGKAIKHDNKKIDLKEQTIRLFYFYEQLYNNKWDYAFPSYKDIIVNTKVRKGYIKYINSKLYTKQKLKMQIGVSFKDPITGEWYKERNKYKPNCNSGKHMELYRPNMDYGKDSRDNINVDDDFNWDLDINTLETNNSG